MSTEVSYQVIGTDLKHLLTGILGDLEDWQNDVENNGVKYKNFKETSLVIDLASRIEDAAYALFGTLQDSEQDTYD